ncbi:hypothetical protein J6590_003899 [Homalodisca vitripennis]|nr:hypothetical protein J6590_003899 [Homalodisca vitripennis]
MACPNWDSNPVTIDRCSHWGTAQAFYRLDHTGNKTEKVQLVCVSKPIIADVLVSVVERLPCQRSSACQSLLAMSGLSVKCLPNYRLGLAIALSVEANHPAVVDVSRSLGSPRN